MCVSLKRSLAEKINFVPEGTPTNVVYVKLPDYVSVEGTLGEPKSKINKLALAGSVLQQLGGSIPGIDKKTGSLLQNLGDVLTGRTGGAGTNAPASGTNQPSSAGSFGADQSGAHGELAPARVSSQALTCGGSNVTLPGPRYRNQDT